MGHWDDIQIDDFRDETMSLIVDIVGLDAAKRIVEIFGGESVYVPKAESLIRWVRDRRIREEFAAGAGYLDLAKKYNLTSRYVRGIVRAARTPRVVNEAQMDLFGQPEKK